MELIKDVDEELKSAQAHLINLQTVGYDLCVIVDMQEEKYKKYKNKICKIVWC